MSRLSHAFLDIVFGNVCFVIVISHICGKRMRFSASSQNSISENSFFGDFEAFFSTYNFLLGRGGFLLLVR